MTADRRDGLVAVALRLRATAVLRLVRLARRPISTETLARGAAAGAFASTLPLLGVQILLAVLIATVVRGSRLVAGLVVWMANPLFFYADYLVGRSLLLRLNLVAPEPVITGWRDVGRVVSLRVLGPMALGALLVGGAVGATAYGTCHVAIGWYRSRRCERAGRSAD